MGPEYYTALNIKVRQWHAAFILPRIRDAEILFEHKWGASDLDAIARLMGFDEERKRMFANAWKIPLPA